MWESSIGSAVGGLTGCVCWQSVDVYSFGVILWEMYCGQRAWAGLNTAQVTSQLTCGSHSHGCSLLDRFLCEATDHRLSLLVYLWVSSLLEFPAVAKLQHSFVAGVHGSMMKG